MKKKFKVQIEYRGIVTVELEAADEKEAESLAISYGSDAIGANIHVHDVQIEEV